MLMNLRLLLKQPMIYPSPKIKFFLPAALLLLTTGLLPQTDRQKEASQARLLVQAEYKAKTYKRKNWRHWIDADKDCQNTRQEILIQYSQKSPSYRSSRNCHVTSGSWTCPYTGKLFTNPRKIDIDHIVALKEAYESGGYLWSRIKKKAFANDFANLLPAQAKANRSKGYRDLAEWIPLKNRCSYLSKWLAIKIKYELSVDQAEKKSIKALTSQCPGLKLPTFVNSK